MIQNLTKEKKIKYIVLLIALIALGLSIYAIVKQCRSYFASDTAKTIAACIKDMEWCNYHKKDGCNHNYNLNDEVHYRDKECSAHGLGSANLTMSSAGDCWDFTFKNKCVGTLTCNNGNGKWIKTDNSTLKCVSVSK